MNFDSKVKAISLTNKFRGDPCGRQKSRRQPTALNVCFLERVMGTHLSELGR
jgi:hypothetical protein